MKKIVIAVVLVLITGVALHGEHDDVRVIVPVMHEGWNLLGFSLQPYVVSDSVVSSGYDAIMYAALDDRVWYFNPNGYVVADTFIMGEGFWLKSFVSAPLIQEGIRSSNRMHVLYSGWNLIASLEKEINPLLLVDSHPTIDSIWGWDTNQHQYKDILAERSVLMPGLGYWVHATHEDTLFYDGFSSQAPPQPPAKMVVTRSQRQPPDAPAYIKAKTWGQIKGEGRSKR